MDVNERGVVVLSYHGPDEAAAGIRAGRLARGCRTHGHRVVLVHGSDSEGEYQWQDQIAIRTFRRSPGSRFRVEQLPTVTRERRPSPFRLAAGRGIKALARTVLQPDPGILAQGRFVEAACGAGEGLQSLGSQLVVIASGPPWSTVLAGLEGARRIGAPLVVDFQDLWSNNPVARWPFLAKDRAHRWERRAIHSAAGLVFVNDMVAADYRARWPMAATRPYAVVPIGFDGPPPFRMEIAPRRNLTIGYFGSLYRDRDFGALLAAVANLRGQGYDVRVRWYGEVLGDHPIRARLGGYVHSGVLELSGRVPHDRVRVLMQQCDWLLVVPSPAYTEELTTKMYDYLDAGRPILGLAANGTLLERFLRASRVGYTRAPTDQLGLEALLIDSLTKGVSLHPDHSFLSSQRTESLGASLHVLLGQIA